MSFPDGPDGNDAPTGEAAASEGHPYRGAGAPRVLEPALERALRWNRRRMRRLLIINAVILPVGLVAGLAIARLHWAGWLLFGALGLYVGFWTLLSAWLVGSTARFDERLRREPGTLEWIHLETEAAGGELCNGELRVRDGDSRAFFVPADLARTLAEVAGRLPLQLTRTSAARAAYLPIFEAEVGLRQLEHRLKRGESSLARHLAPHLLAPLGGRAVVRAGDPTTTLTSALARFGILLDAAAKFDMSNRRVGSQATPAVAPVRSDPPYLAEATRLAQVISAALGRTDEPRTGPR